MEKQRVLITGLSGFVGQNLYSKLNPNFDIQAISRNDDDKDAISYSDFFEQESKPYDALVHLAGKAHDLKNVSDGTEYFEVNYELTKKLYNKFLQSDAHTFIYISSVKAVKDVVPDILTEDAEPKPLTFYGKSKKAAEDYILANIPGNKRVYILRPCMIHGRGNKGNLNLLYSIISKGIPYPLAAFHNKRSFLSVDNLCFIIDKLLVNEAASGVYNVADDEPLSTNEVIGLIKKSLGKKEDMVKVPKSFIKAIAKTGDMIKFIPLNSERLQKLTENYIVSNTKIKAALGISLPLSAHEGLEKTFDSFKNN